MKVLIIQRYLIGFAALLALLLGVFCQVNAQEKVDGNLPANERELRDKLEQDKSVLRIIYTGKYSEDNRVRLSLYEAARSGEGVVKAKIVSPTDEGTEIVYYLIVQEGIISLVEDFSRDPFGSLRVHSYTCGSLMLGSNELREGKVTFEPIPDGKIASVKNKTTFSLQCKIKDDKNKRQFAQF